jgi:hypothetical protein
MTRRDCLALLHAIEETVSDRTRDTVCRLRCARTLARTGITALEADLAPKDEAPR